MSKYEPLHKYLAGQSAKRLTLEMQEIEQILGEQLPASAHRHVAWWSNGTTHHHPQCRAWMENDTIPCMYWIRSARDTLNLKNSDLHFGGACLRVSASILPVNCCCIAHFCKIVSTSCTFATCGGGIRILYRPPKA